MATLREMVYMCVDQLKSASDDSYFNEEHIIWLLNKFRALILKRLYSSSKQIVPESNYQTLCLELIKVDAIPELPCEGGQYVRSKEKIPPFMYIGHKKVYAVDYFQGYIEYVPLERFRWAGRDKWRRNIIYTTIAPDHYLYFRSQNPQFLYLKDAKFTAIFEDPEKANKLSCEQDGSPCDILDIEYPIEESLVMQLVEMVVQEILKPTYTPENSFNNAADDQGQLGNKEAVGNQAQQEAAAQQAAAQAAAEQQNQQQEYY